MVIKIFYFFVALFAIAFAFLSLQTPYLEDFIDKNLSVANVAMDGITDYEINASVVSMRATAKSGSRFHNRSEFEQIFGQYATADRNHTLTARKGLYKGDVVTFSGDANYTNSDGYEYLSDIIAYNTAKRTLESKKPYILTQGPHKVTGNSLKYDIDKKRTNSKGVHGWYYTDEQTAQ